MSALSLLTRKTLALVVSGTVLAAGFTASTGVSAHPIFPIPFPHPLPHPLPFPHPVPGPHVGGPGYGWGGAGFAGGIALGALVRGAAYAGDGGCTIARRLVVDPYGNEYVRLVRICY